MISHKFLNAAVVAKHHLWNANEIVEEKPFKRYDNSNKRIYDQLYRRNTCGVYCVQNLFGNIKSFYINNSTIVNELLNLTKQLNHTHIVSSKTGNVHRV